MVLMPRSMSRLLGCCLLTLMAAGCSLNPGCANRDAKASIEKDARSSVELWLKSIGQSSLASKASYKLVGTYETDRAESTRSCSGSVSVQIDKDKVVVPIDYQVIGADDGSVMYRWDAAAFGKDFISRALTGALANAVASPPSEEPSPPSEAAPAQGSDPTEAVGAAMNHWRNEVRETIVAEVGKANVEGSGTVGVEFTVLGSGAISGVKVSRSSGSAALDAAAVKIIERVETVVTPPSQKDTTITMKLSFL